MMLLANLFLTLFANGQVALLHTRDTEQWCVVMYLFYISYELQNTLVSIQDLYCSTNMETGHLAACQLHL